jgi:CAAX prenyl protease-like protein
MSFEPLRPGDKRLLIVAIVLVAAGLSYTYLNYAAAFPQASLQLKYSKTEIVEIAEGILQERGLSTDGYRNLTLFTPDHSARLFLERELGLEAANRLMEGEVSVWRWRARWFQPPEKEELLVYLSPDGKLVGFEHVLPEAAPGARLERDAALEIASEFLRQQTSEPHELAEEQIRDRPARVDHIFVWEREGFKAKDATYRRTVVIQGDEIGEYSEYLHVPERWDREYAALRSSNELYSSIAQVLYLLLGLAALVVLFQSLHRREIRWKPLIGLSAAAGVLAVLNEWNFLPFYIDGMPTSTGLPVMVILSLLQGLGAGVGYFFMIILGLAPGESLYRKLLPDRLSVAAAFSVKGIHTREFFRATLVGYAFTGVHLAFLVAFYLVSKRMGAWSPQDVDYSNVLSTAAPWIYPMTIGVLASASEEFWFRLLAVPLLKRLTGSTWVAVLIPAFVWGFLHANYPQQPGFIRGLEVGLIGVAAGFLLLRFGILATLIWHYTVDAVLVSSILFESSVWYFWVAGVVVSCAVLIPLGISLVHYRRNGGFLVGPPLLNRNQPPPEHPEETTVEPPGPPIPARWPVRILYLAAGVALVIGLMATHTNYGDFVKVETPRSDAGRIAAQALAARGHSPAEWRSVTRFVPNLNVAEFEYFRRLNGADEANRIVEQTTFHGVWEVRFFRPEDPEEWRVYVNQAGEAYRLDHVLDETAAGADLTPDVARLLVERHLSDAQGIDLSAYRLADNSENKRDHRTDHNFVWEERGFDVGDAQARISASVIGDEVSYFRKLIKLPEEWVREFTRPRLRGYITPALAGGIAFPLLVIFVTRVGSRSSRRDLRYHWRIYAAIGLSGGVLAAANAMNQWTGAFSSYNTAEPVENFVSQWIIGRVVMVLLASLGTFVLCMAVDVFLQISAGNRALPHPLISRALATAILLWGGLQGASALADLAPGDRFDLSLLRLSGVANSVPAIDALSESFFGALVPIGVAVILVAAFHHYLWNRAGVAVAAGLMVLAALGQSAGILQFGAQLMAYLLLAGLVYLLVNTCGLDLVGFAVALFWLEAAESASTLIEQPSADLRWNGVLAAGIALVLGIAILLICRRAKYPEDPRMDSPMDPNGAS